MAHLKTARPARRKASSMLQFRQRIPADILSQVRGQKLFVPVGDETVELRVSPRASEVVLSLRTADPREADRRHTAVKAYLQNVYMTLRAGGPVDLTHKQSAALAGKIHKAWTKESLTEDMVRILGSSQAAQEAWERTLENLQAADDKGDAAPAMAPLLRILLQGLGVSADPDEAVAAQELTVGALKSAFAHQMQVAGGDYSEAHGTAAAYPEWDDVAPPGVTWDDLLAAWASARAPSPGSRKSYRNAVTKLKAHVNDRPPSQVKTADIRKWRDELGKTLKASSVNDGHLAPIKALYSYGINNGLLFCTNPADGIRDERKKPIGTSQMPYDDDDVAAILALANAETDPTFRWVPWLMALTGARVNELTQLWESHVKKVSGIAVLSITPTDDGGRVKNDVSVRDVPIHPALIDMGFLKFVESRKGKPLFYQKPHEVLNPDSSYHPAKGQGTRLQRWVRRKGFDDPRKAPNHAFRHWFKSVCPEFGILDSQANHLQGHKGRDGEADKYRHRRIKAMYDALCRLQIPKPSLS